jgi:imidazolonepropionase-like amidohydrolase
MVVFAAASLTLAHDYPPAPPQERPILLRGGDLYTVTNGILKNTDLLFIHGRISQIGQSLTPPDNTEVIDISGSRVYPGLIASFTTIGLTEIGEVRATLDISEVGQVNPNVKAYTAYNPDSEIIPTVRSNGITTALVVPHGSLVMGLSSLINLDGWTVEDAAEKLIVGLHVNWPRSTVSTAWWIEKTEEEQRKENEENRRKLYELFTHARAYHAARTADSTREIDLRWEAMRPLFAGELPLVVVADDYREIEQAVAFAKENGFKLVVAGGGDSWMLADVLKENNVPVIVGETRSWPRREDDMHDLPYRIPYLLDSSGVTFALSTGSTRGGDSWSARNLPFEAAEAIAYGLSYEKALRAVTLTPAEIFGVDQDLGSLEIGKKATLIVAEGDLFDPMTHRVTLEFIDGRKVNLDNKHRELYRKYQEKIKRAATTAP